MKILIIEDEPAIRDSMVQSLKQEQYVVETATDYSQAREKLDIYEYDCVLLDINLPDGNGLAILGDLKKQSKKEGVIIVSAKNSVEDKIEGLDLGADDYLAKPFHMAELHARVKSVLRRKKLDGDQYITCNNLKIDAENRALWVNEKEVILNRKEFDILLYMMMNRNRLVNKTALAEHVWGDYIDEANSFDFIYSQIRNLRKKLKDVGTEVDIQAVYGVGYKLTCR